MIFRTIAVCVVVVLFGSSSAFRLPHIMSLRGGSGRNDNKKLPHTTNPMPAPKKPYSRTTPAKSVPILSNAITPFRKNYPFSQRYYEEAVRRLNSQNATEQTDAILRGGDRFSEGEGGRGVGEDGARNGTIGYHPEIQIIIGGFYGQPVGDEFDPFGENDGASDDEETDTTPYGRYGRRGGSSGRGGSDSLKSKNFEVVKNYPLKFEDVGGYEKIKDELRQSIDILRHYKKYTKYNVRIPKGLIFEGPPGNGKTLLAKSLAGESRCGFIAVSGSDFQEKYVGVGSSRIRELFELAKKNVPCIVFIDEIDALGRKRSGDGEISSSERDSTLNSLLVELDGFKNNTGVFLVGATNRIDLLDPALVRAGRIDKKIYVGLPDAATRKAVIQIHIVGKPREDCVRIADLVEITDGLSCAQIESLLNEAMLYALRNDRREFTYSDVDFILNKIIAGWQSSDHEFTEDMVERITVHEMGHAILGIVAKHHSKMLKVILNLSSPRTPGYTVFERSASNIYLKEALFEHLIILLGGRIAEEVVYNVSITTGAINDFEEALKLAERMILHYGMGDTVLYPSNSEKYKEIVDNEVSLLINHAYILGRSVLGNCREAILETSSLLRQEKRVDAATLTEIIQTKYPEILTWRDVF